MITKRDNIDIYYSPYDFSIQTNWQEYVPQTHTIFWWKEQNGLGDVEHILGDPNALDVLIHPNTSSVVIISFFISSSRIPVYRFQAQCRYYYVY